MPILPFLLLLSLSNLHPSLSIKSPKSTYIVHLANSDSLHESSLRSVSDSAQFLYHYSHALHGYATRLTNSEANSLASHPDVLSVVPDSVYALHTTRSPEFLGLPDSYSDLPASAGRSDIIVGVLDTGVWPESKSFDDAGMDPIPNSWNGDCESGTNFTAEHCNKKLIGARYFTRGYESAAGPIDESKESRSARDDDGHGTHTATTAAGAAVEDASLLGFANGTARGMATRARVAAYKVCWKGGCFSSDILAAMDRAIGDGVDVMSLSLGGGAADYYRDSVAIGAYAAVERGIVVVCSAGNAGPSKFSLSNQAPWITTVGAGTLDRDFPAGVTVGSGRNFSGVSLFKGEGLPSELIPIVFAGNASNMTNGNLCMTGTLIPEKVSGKLVLCERGISPRVQKGSVVKAASGAGMILANTAANGEELVADAHLLPATSVGFLAGQQIKSYILSSTNPTATISFQGTKLGITPSPVVAAFSSRGPNGITPDILKPDMIAPGVNILAGWSGSVGPTGLPMDERRVGFNIISGTSMSCPHVSGLSALIKADHPDWSPAAIKSALMTTAYVAYKDGQLLRDVASGKASTAFDHGAGHVDPVSALDPGLVYDLTPDDYLGFLCALGYTPSQIKLVSRSNSSCESGKKYGLADFNYPSFAVSFQGGVGGTVRHSRTLTNVGSPGTYKVRAVSNSAEVKVSVEPESLVFGKVNEKMSYVVSFVSSGGMSSDSNAFGRIEWSDGKHVVGSPVAFSWT